MTSDTVVTILPEWGCVRVLFIGNVVTNPPSLPGEGVGGRGLAECHGVPLLLGCGGLLVCGSKFPNKDFPALSAIGYISTSD